jgi:hypothetical protein
VRRQARQLPHGLLGVRRGQGHAAPVGDHPERGVLGGREVDVLAGDRADEGELEHLGKPHRAQRGIAEHPREVWVEGPQVEQPLVHVEQHDRLHRGSHVA